MAHVNGVYVGDGFQSLDPATCMPIGLVGGIPLAVKPEGPFVKVMLDPDGAAVTLTGAPLSAIPTLSEEPIIPVTGP